MLNWTDVDLDYVAQVLEPVLGTVDLSVPAWLMPLDEILQAANQCAKLSDLLNSGILEKGRKLKAGCGENYFQSVAMVAFTRFSFLMRRVFFRLLHQDLNAIGDGLRQLETRGVRSLDCRRAQFSADEPTSRLRMICQSWKVMFHAEYSSGQPLKMLVDLRSVVDSALARIAKGAVGKPPSTTPHQPRAQAAAANANRAEAPEIIEFEVSSGAPEWGQDSSAGHKPDPGDGKA